MSLISRVFQFKRGIVPIAPELHPLMMLSLTAVLSIGSIFSFAPKATAIETVELQYQDRTLTTTVDRIKEYSATGVASEDLQTFLGGDTQLAEIVSQLLVEEITLTGNLRDRLRDDLQKSSIGQFVLYQLNKLIVGSEDLSNLQTAIRTSLEDDDRLSLLEVAQNYSGADRVTLNLTEVGVVYADVKGFVERVVPALEVAREYLQDYVCDCETAQSSDASTPASENTPEVAPENTPEAAPETVPSLPPATTDAPEEKNSEPMTTPQSQGIGDRSVMTATTDPCYNRATSAVSSTSATAPSSPLLPPLAPEHH